MFLGSYRFTPTFLIYRHYHGGTSLLGHSPLGSREK